MEQLCPHIRPIYAELIDRGNSVASVFTPEGVACKLVVEMNLELPESVKCSLMKREQPPRNSPYDFPESRYLCRECGCEIVYLHDGS